LALRRAAVMRLLLVADTAVDLAAALA